MAVVMINKTNMTNGHLQNQLTRSLERILEDSHLSGELRLSGRKLKDFPKAAGKYNLRDTVIADLSRNRFCELPEDVTSFIFMETLIAYHNTIRTIPDTIKELQSLAYLDLRNNQLTVLPREICFLPLLVLLVSNNRLVSLPEELGRMRTLTELDAACNQITQLPVKIGELVNLKSLSLRSNQLLFLPREITCLQLVSLDISCNRIAALPVELRSMSSLVELDLDNNPLTSPPASLCIRGLVHVFKYLETLAQKEDKTKSYESVTLRRQLTPRHINSIVDNPLNRNQYNNANDFGFDKRWVSDEQSSKFSPTHLHGWSEGNSISNILTKSNVSPDGNNTNPASVCFEDELQRNDFLQEHQRIGMNNHNNSGDASEDDHDIHDKNRSIGIIQTYREYKEALRQQRNQDSSSIYRPKEQIPSSQCILPSSNPASPKIQIVATQQKIFGTNQSSSNLSNYATNNKIDNGTLSPTMESQNSSNNSSPILNRTLGPFDENCANKRPIQKVTPSRNINGSPNVDGKLNGKNSEYNSYIKPSSPIKTCGISTFNTVSTGVLKNGNLQRKFVAKPGVEVSKGSRSVSWKRDISSEKMTFTMRREIDKQKEESELIEQLRTIIETKLKISLPEDIASALTDGVVLCHLANYVRPRSVASIHVPSPTVPKLTMARCRKNVDNFIEACKKIGVDQELICFCNDVIPSDDTSEINNPPDPSKMFRTIRALLHIKQREEDTKNHHQYPSDHLDVTATNTKYTLQNVQSENVGIPFINSTTDNFTEILVIKNPINESSDASDQNNLKLRYRKAPDTLNLSSNYRNKISKIKTKFQRDIISEECEYDSDIGKFNCKTTSEFDQYPSEESCLSTPSLNNDFIYEINDLNTPKQQQKENFNSFQLSPSVTNCHQMSQNNINEENGNNLNSEMNKIVMKRIEFFENNLQTSNEKIINKTIDCIEQKNDQNNSKNETIILLTVLIFTIIILLYFPLS